VRILLTGVCGFAGNVIAQTLRESSENLTILGLDNLSRAGSETNRAPLRACGIEVVHGDVRARADVEALPKVDWVIDAAANPSVLAGVNSSASSRQIVDHNLSGTINLLEYCRQHGAGLVLLSTSRVYSIAAMAALPVVVKEEAFVLDAERTREIPGVSARGIAEAFSTEAPISLYGATKLASEQLALEYGNAFHFPVWINRCGVLAGAGQFGRADQGIFSFWIHSWAAQRPLTYLGFGGEGHQVRDCLHPRDLVPLLLQQFRAGGAKNDARSRIQNIGGGIASARSLQQLSAWCADRFGPRPIGRVLEQRMYDVPWVVLDWTRARQMWDWTPQTPVAEILEEIAAHAEAHPHWLELTGS
jgi:CDP-paratose 2-epimerase